MKTIKALRRQPRGVLASKPVFCQLMPEERIALECLSQQLGHSISSVMRDIFLVGIGPYSEKLGSKRRNRTQTCMRAIEQ